MDELVACAKDSRFLKTVIGFDGTANHDAELDRIALSKSVRFEAVPTGRDDVALLGFTSGTTGEPKATMHFHRDLLIIADGYAREVLGVTPDDVFVGSPPLAFTFGLGGLAIFPLRFGATATLLETASPQNMIEIIETHRATICFTAPTAYRVMLKAMDEGADLSSLRCAVSAGETLPGPVYEEWLAKTGKPMLDGIGATEMLHIFITNRFGDSFPATTGRPVTGYRAKVVDEDDERGPPRHRRPARRPGPDRLPLPRRPRARRTTSATAGTSPATPSSQDEDGYFHFAARNDDMILSAGYNIAGPEVEAALLAHADVARMRRDRRAPTPTAARSCRPTSSSPRASPPDAATAKRLQDHVKATDRPLQVPALGDLRGRAAQDRHRQDPALRAARRQARRDRRLRQQRRTTR